MQRLKKRRDFLAAAKGGKAARGAFLLEVRDRGDAGDARVGFTVSKRTAMKAVERNRMRRRLQSLVRDASPQFVPGHDYVLVARRRALTEDFSEMQKSLASALNQLRRSSTRVSAISERSSKP